MTITNPPVLKHVEIKVESHKAYLTIRRPEALNSLNRQVLLDLIEAAQFLKEQNGIKVVLLSGSGEKAFVAGADIREMQPMSMQQAHEFATLGAAAFQAIEDLPQIVIAGIQGWALGGGLELALSADFMIASSAARFGFPEVSLGIIPGFGGTQRLPRRIGLARAIEWISSAEKYSANDALAAGLVNRVVPQEDLRTTLENIAEKISANGPAALKAVKQVMRQGSSLSQTEAIAQESAAFGRRFDQEGQEGMAAFQEKRKPNF